MKYSIKKALGIIAAALIFSTVTVPLSDYDYAVNYTEAIKESEAGVNDAEKILNDVLLCMSETVKEPNFGTNFGEWSVISLARGSFYSRDDKYFSDYYDRISEAVNITAASVNRSGALHKSKSAENSRLILALSAIGRSPENVGGWNLIEPYEDFSWIKNQGINGPAYALIALDSLDYHTSDPTIRQQCIDFILEKQFDDGGWALSGKNADPDITAIVLQSLAPYMSDDNVYQAAVRGIDRLSQMQLEDGCYRSWGTVHSESLSQVIVACTALGIDPNTDERFVKNGISAVDALLGYYDESSKTFCHTKGDGGSAMATDQAAYALISYDRFINGENPLYDMSDVFDEDHNINPDDNGNIADPDTGDQSNGNFPNEPEIQNPDDIAADDYPDTEYDEDEDYEEIYEDEYEDQNNDSTESRINTEISSKESHISEKNNSSHVPVQTSEAKFDEDEVKFSAVCLYNGDDSDIISSSKMAVAVAADNLSAGVELKYDDGKNTAEFFYNKEASDLSGIPVYIALVDSGIDIISFTKSENYIINNEVLGESVVFGDVNGDGIINAQDALDTLNVWMQKSEITEDKQLLSLNVNSDRRINNLDAVEISEAFISGYDFEIIRNIVSLLGEK